MNRIAIIYTPAGGGHRSAAKAIAAELAQLPNTIVDVRNVLDFAPRWFAYDRVWDVIQQRGRHLWDWVFDATATKAGLRGVDIDPVRLPLNALLFNALDRYLLDFAPTHIVCTHYLPAMAIARIRDRTNARVVVTVTDHIAHRAWLVPGVDSYCVADPTVARALRRQTTAEVHVTGIPIARNTASLRAPEVHIERARVLALLNGCAKRDARATVEALAPLTRTCDLHVLCGDDPELLAYAQARLPGAEVAARADGLYAAIDRADVVVTKAGGLTVSECLARGRAMVLPFLAPGQERGNLFYALDAGAAVRPAELADLADTIEGLVREPGKLRKMAARARHASHPNSAAEVVTCMFGHAEARRVA